MIILAIFRQPKWIDNLLQLYIIIIAMESINITLFLQNLLHYLLLQIFSNTPINISYKYYKPFGYLVHALDPNLQRANHINKQKPRLKPRIHLSHSLLHNKNIVLVLNIKIERVSSQFHIIFNKYFQTILQNTIKSQQKIKEGFINPIKQNKLT